MPGEIDAALPGDIGVRLPESPCVGRSISEGGSSILRCAGSIGSTTVQRKTVSSPARARETAEELSVDVGAL